MIPKTPLLVIANTLFNKPREDSTHGHHQMVDNKIRLIIFFAAKDGEALYSQQKQDLELTVAQIMNSAAAAAAKLLQSCPTLCEPTDSSPPVSTVPQIL